MKGSLKLNILNRIDIIKKQIDQSNDKLKNDIQKLKNHNADFVARKQKEIINIRTQIRKA